MKKIIVVFVLVFGVSLAANAQDKMMKSNMAETSEVITLEQTPGEFTRKSLSVPEGTYVFEIKNNGIDHNVGFVLVKKGQDISKPENHIQTAYVTAPVGTDQSERSKPTLLTKGEYIYFCPLNPTATDNLLTVQ